MSLKDKIIFITGGSRGIGLAVAKRAAQDGAKIVIAAKTTEPHPTLPGTIYTAAEEIVQAGGQALPLKMNIREVDEIHAAVGQAVDHFGGIDILINNASAISLTGTLQTDMKRFDLMHECDVRGTFATSQACLPHLLKAENPHILNNSPPLSMKPKWFANTVAYTMAKYGMSMCTLGMAEEFKEQGVAVNSIWPITPIATAALKIATATSMDDTLNHARKPVIMADAVYWILTQPSRECTGNFFVDELVLREAGVTNFDHYAYSPGHELARDFYLDDEYFKGI